PDNVNVSAASRILTLHAALPPVSTEARAVKNVPQDGAIGSGAAAARALGWILATLAVARALLAFVPSMWAWGLNPLRFDPPLLGGSLWALAAVALIPAVGRRLEPLATAIADPAASPWRAYLPWMLAVSLAAWALPDRLHFVGDYLLRDTTGATQSSVLRSLYPQGFPLDLFLHDTLVREIDAASPLD